VEVACRRHEESPAANVSYQGYVVAPSYAYEMTGRKDRVKGYVMRVDKADELKSPGLVILAHLMNYDKPALNIRVGLNLDGVVKQIDKDKIRLLSPDGGARQPIEVSARGSWLQFVVPNLDVYDVVTIND
jgi:gamma-glutamylcyclotransferase (GGCT)/AIG2-like uncharacterized protein YtfP